MTPDELCRKGTESGEQKALFAWAAMACYKGFAIANLDDAYCAKRPGVVYDVAALTPHPVPELKWLHAIPNGGKRDAITASRMKAEGVRVGVADVFLPVARMKYHGLYIEMKKDGGRLSEEQIAFGKFVSAQGYLWKECVGWKRAAMLLQDYLS